MPLLTLAAIFSVALGADPSTVPDAAMLRYPDIGRKDIVFVFAGNLWLVPKEGGTARPLTSAAGAEVMPRFSPDGDRIAFVGNYDGNRDIYVMPVGGGSPFRVTHHPAGEVVNEWTGDGSLVFTASGMEGIARASRLYRVSEAGGLPQPLPVPYGTNGTISPDGEWLAYTPHSIDNRTWKRYRGGMQTDVWVVNLKTGESRRATDHEGIDTLPMWEGSMLYYLSDAVSDPAAPHKLNIWSWDLKSGARRQVTHFTDEDVKWPAIGAGEIVFQKGTKLMVLDLATGQSRAVEVRIPGDRPTVRTRTEDVADQLQGSSISPSAKRVAVAARGDIWSAPAENGVPRNMTRTDGVAERTPAWSPDGKWIAYFSDATGEYELWAMPSDGKGEPRQLTKDGGPFKTWIRWFPDSTKLLYQDKTGSMYLVDFASGDRKLVDREPWDGGLDPSISHDGSYLAYTKSLPERRNSSVWIYDVAKGEAREVTSGQFADRDATFDRTGDWLYFTSQRGFGNAQYSELDTGWAYQDTSRGYAVPLRKDVKNPWAVEIDEEKGKDAKKDDKKDEEKKDEEKKEGDGAGAAPADGARPAGPGGDRPMRRRRPQGELPSDQVAAMPPRADDPPKQDAPAAPAAAGPAGTWTCTAALGEREVAFTLEVTLGEGGTVTAAYRSEERTGDLKGTWDEAARKLVLAGTYAPGTENETAYAMEATIDGDAITGNVTATSGDGEAKFAFSGKRAPAEGAKQEDGKKDEPKKDDAKKDEKKPFAIDYDGFEARAIELPLGTQRIGGMAVNDRGHLLFAQGGQIKLFDIKDRKREVKKVADGMGFELTADGRRMLAGLSILDASPGASGKQVVTQPMLAEINPRNEWKQVVRDAWRIFRDYFYDPNMHGVDWDGIGTRYLAMVDDANSREDVSYIISEMISELNVGHAYYSGGREGGGGPSLNVGMLGVDWEPVAGPDGRNVYRVKHVVEGAAWDADARNPLRELGIDVKEGDHLLAVNGRPVDGSKDPWAAFQSLAGKTVSLTVGPNPAMDDKVREVVVKPLGGEDGLRYRDWIEANRRYVAEKSGGKVGYIYVPNTGIDGQSDLVRQFQGERFKPALIVDDRWNGGGQIPTRFIEMLNRPTTNYWARRDQQDWIWPPDSHVGPKAMLINGLAGSGGDMFPWLFKRAGLGPLVGTRTWGGLVGISGNPGMIDGSGVRVPVFAFYETDGTWGIEGHGVDPDHEVLDDPGVMKGGPHHGGIDPQLDKAVELLLAELEKNPVKHPARPAYPKREGFGIAPEDK